MAEYKLELKKREIVGKKTNLLRKEGLIPSVVYGGKEPILGSSEYVATEKILEKAGYHSPIDLTIDGKKKMVIVKDVHIDPVSRRIVNIEFQSIKANEIVEATTPIAIVNFEALEAAKTFHFALNQTIEEIDVKAKPAALPSELTIDATKMKELDDKITIADIKLPEGVEFADKEIDTEQVVATLFDPAAEAEKREAEEEAAAEEAETENSEAETATEESTEEAKELSEEKE